MMSYRITLFASFLLLLNANVCQARQCSIFDSAGFRAEHEPEVKIQPAPHVVPTHRFSIMYGPPDGKPIKQAQSTAERALAIPQIDAAQELQSRFFNALIDNNFTLIRQLIALPELNIQLKLLGAVKLRDVETVKRLLQMPEANINGESVAGRKDRPIEWAADIGSPEITRELILHGARVKPDSQQDDGAPVEPIYVAAAALANIVNPPGILLRNPPDPNYKMLRGSPHDYIETIRILLNAGADPNAHLRNSNYRALVLVVNSPYFPEKNELVKLFVQYGADVDFGIKVGYGSPLMIAAQRGETELVKTMLQYSQKKRNSLNQALILGVRNHHIDVAELLLKNGADVNINRDSPPDALIFDALIPTTIPQMLDVMVKYGVNVNVHEQNYGNTPLMYVVHQPILVEKILRAGANPNAKNKQGETALFRALEVPDVIYIPENKAKELLPLESKNGRLNPDTRIRAVSILLDHDADPNLEVQSVAPLMLVRKNETGLIDLLLKKGARIPANNELFQDFKRGDFDIGPITWAILNDKEYLALALMKRDKEVSIQDCGAIYYAAQYGKPKVLNALLDLGVDTDVADSNQGLTPFMAAAYAGQMESLKILLSKGKININAPTKEKYHDLYGSGGKTALMFAAMKGDRNVVKYLLEQGVNINQKDIDGRTSLDYARDFGTPEVEKLLIDSRTKAK